MSNSSLVNVKVMAHSSNYTQGRKGKKIKKITIHHMAGKLTAKQCGNVFQKKGRNASSNYGIGSDGKIGLYVDEANRAWTSSNADNDYEAVTIEVANSQIGGQWKVSSKSLKLLIKLCVDICKRNGIKKLEKGKTLTWHSMFAKTTCPGPYLLSKFDYICKKVNAELEKAEKKNTVGKTKILKKDCTLYSKSNLSGTKYTYKKNTTVKILKNISSTVDYVEVKATGRKAYIKNKYYK